MGRMINDTSVGGDFPPTAELREKDAMLKGIIMGKEERDLGFGLTPVYKFQVLEASCRFLLQKQEVQPEEGAIVEVIAPTRLARQLGQLNVGDTVTIKNAGTKQIGRGKPAHIFSVEVA